MISPAHRLLALLIVSAAFAGASAVGTAQPASSNVSPAVAPRSAASSAAGLAAARQSFPRPTWAQLTVQQQIALRPLASVWDPLSEAQKRKWLELSKNHQNLSVDDQTRMHSRMVEWVGMSPQQRAQARLNFAQTRELATSLSADEKKAKWQSYQALSAEEKQKLAEKAVPRPTGAATAIKPVAPQKLTATSAPAAPRANRAEIKITPLLPTSGQ
jgi:hypothetical protein